ncbi:MAG: hypothetical protein J6T55_03245 [Alphaproteobacteria bacterium]|nr:hypothetical protein [Alphaproteobacteria bacterium]
MRFTESKKRKPWGLIVFGILLLGSVLIACFYRFDPTPQTIQKTIVFEAD